MSRFSYDRNPHSPSLSGLFHLEPAMRLYAEISKTEKLEDGTLKVWGYASSEAVDSDGETITADAMKAALPDYLKFGAVREMHQPMAAGTAIEAEVQDDGRTWFGALVVDPVACKKVETGVYKGFSIGGKVTARDDINKTVITGLRLVEVSLVDRPANPEAVFTMFKAETEKAEAVEPEAPPAEPITKGLWSIRDFAEVLASIGWIARDAQEESTWEGDASPIPAALRAWLAQGVEIFRGMAVEETAELLADLKSAAGEIDVIAMAAAGCDLAKAGRKYSAATKAALAELHKCVKDADAHLAKLGYDADDADEAEEEAEEKEPEGDKEKSASPDDLAKSEVSDDTEQVSEIAKAAGITLEAGATASDLLKAAVAEVIALRKANADFLAQPAPPKGSVFAVSKAEDRGESPTKTDEPVKKHDGSVDEVATEVKAAFSRPIRIA